jgi:hypothetical protein
VTSHRGTRKRNHFGSRHPLAAAARRRCDDEHGVAGAALIGGVACGQCWEYVIRADERVVVEHGLPPDAPADHGLVDEVAVNRACEGARVPLTPLERAVVVARLTAQGLTPRAIAARLRVSARLMAVLGPASWWPPSPHTIGSEAA